MSTSIVKAKANKAPYPFTLGDTYVSLVVEGRPFILNEQHPTFYELRNALVKKAWKKVPHLVTVAAKIANKSHGAVTVNNKGVFYKGREVHSSLTERMQKMMSENKEIAHMIKFMDNLYNNPDEHSINELFDFLTRCNLPITDDGCFMAYKMVNNDYTDCHTGKMDNTPGQILFMKRSAVDPDRRNQCSRGLHFCSREYLSSGFGGGRLMRVKINPKDVVSIPEDYGFSKGRTWKYEVIDEIKNGEADKNTDHPSMLTSVVEVAQERKTLLANILSHKTVKRAVSRGKWKDTSIRKWSYGQLVKFWGRLPHDITVAPGDQSKLFDNTLRVAREQAKISLKEMSEELDLNYKAVWAAERSTNLRQSTIDRYLEAVESIKNSRTKQPVSYGEDSGDGDYED